MQHVVRVPQQELILVTSMMIVVIVVVVVVIPPYGRMGYLVYCVFFVIFSFCLYGCGSLSGEKGRGVTFCMRVRLLYGMSFAHFGELWLAGSHGSGITSGMYAATNWCQAAAPGEAR